MNTYFGRFCFSYLVFLSLIFIRQLCCPMFIWYHRCRRKGAGRLSNPQVEAGTLGVEMVEVAVVAGSRRAESTPLVGHSVGAAPRLALSPSLDVTPSFTAGRVPAVNRMFPAEQLAVLNWDQSVDPMDSDGPLLGPAGGLVVSALPIGEVSSSLEVCDLHDLN